MELGTRTMSVLNGHKRDAVNSDNVAAGLEEVYECILTSSYKREAATKDV